MTLLKTNRITQITKKPLKDTKLLKLMTTMTTANLTQEQTKNKTLTRKMKA